jgi:preprotein translocase subunit SecD
MGSRRKYVLSVLAMLVLVAAMWGGIAIGCSEETSLKDGKPVSTCKRPMKPQLGLDLEGGISIVLSPKAGADTSGLDKAVDIIRQRVDALGVAEPDVGREGSNIRVEIPGIKDPQRAGEIIGRTAQMRFRPVLGELPAGTPEWEKAPPPDCALAADTPDDPAKPGTFCLRVKRPDGGDQPFVTWPKMSLGPARLIGTDVAGADARIDTNSGTWQISLRLTGDGAKKFEKVTGELACKPAGSLERQLAIVLDGVVESHPQVGEDVKCGTGISGGNAQITGNFSQKEAKDLALVLRYGALPVALETSETNIVSATLGRDSLRGGLIAGAIGLGLVLIYVLLFYRILGLVIWLGLVLFTAFVLGFVILLGKTAGFSLTLAGIAGIIVSIGIATDSFIVYFERLKDEVHQGKTIRASVDRAWSSAWRTIVAADLVTALAAGALYLLAVGSVRGFALTLGISTALDLFISRLYMHPIVWLLAQTKFFNQSKRFGIRRVVGAEAPAVAGGAR